MPLSKWIKRLVEGVLAGSPTPNVHGTAVHNGLVFPVKQEKSAKELDSTFEQEWMTFLRRLYEH